MAFLHALPADAVEGNTDTVKIGRVRMDRSVGVYAYVWYGQDPGDGTFDVDVGFRGPSRHKTLKISNMEDFLSSIDLTSLSGDFLEMQKQAIAEYADANNLWHTQQ